MQGVIMEQGQTDKVEPLILFTIKDVILWLSLILEKICYYCRRLDNSAYLKIIFLISQPKLMLWVLKITVSMKRFFWAPKTHV